MGVWFVIVVIVGVAVIGVWLGRRRAFGRGYSNNHQEERDANRHRTEDPRWGGGPTSVG